MRFEYKTIMNLPQYVPTDAIMYLSSVGINIVRGSNRMLYEYVIDINGYISDRINNCSKLFPIWLNWQYVRDLFVMPNGRTQEGTRAAAEAYYSNRMNYPYQSYINWKVEPDQGNILLNDKILPTSRRSLMPARKSRTPYTISSPTRKRSSSSSTARTPTRISSPRRSTTSTPTKSRRSQKSSSTTTFTRRPRGDFSQTTRRESRSNTS